MESLNVSQVESLEQVKVIAPIAGLTKTNVEVKSDSKTNELFITTTDPKDLDKDIMSKFNFAKESVIELDGKYDVTKAKVTVTNGILLITVPVSADRIRTIEID